MKIIGLIGGMSWESSALYYQKINQKIQKKLGGLHSAKLVLFSVDFSEIEYFQSTEQWDKAGELLAEIAIKLETINVDAIALCTNTMHVCADEIQQVIQIPFLHIAEALSDQLILDGKHKILLLGTKFTMQQSFYKSKLSVNGIEVVTPNFEHQEIIHSVIYDELCQGVINESSKQKYMDIIMHYGNQVDAIVLGCTEIGMLISQDDLALPIYDTTEIHVNNIVNVML